MKHAISKIGIIGLLAAMVTGCSTTGLEHSYKVLRKYGVKAVRHMDVEIETATGDKKAKLEKARGALIKADELIRNDAWPVVKSYLDKKK
tara:strand:+ start:3943 stop:4212 length:270 start_codon:yes stop_codon:yes gene_type:complete